MHGKGKHPCSVVELSLQTVIALTAAESNAEAVALKVFFPVVASQVYVAAHREVVVRMRSNVFIP